MLPSECHTRALIGYVMSPHASHVHAMLFLDVATYPEEGRAQLCHFSLPFVPFSKGTRDYSELLSDTWGDEGRNVYGHGPLIQLADMEKMTAV